MTWPPRAAARAAWRAGACVRYVYNNDAYYYCEACPPPGRPVPRAPAQTLWWSADIIFMRAPARPAPPCEREHTSTGAAGALFRAAAPSACGAQPSGARPRDNHGRGHGRCVRGGGTEGDADLGEVALVELAEHVEVDAVGLEDPGVLLEAA